MSWCWGTLKWGEQEDGTFHLCIPNREIQKIYRGDCEYAIEQYGESYDLGGLLLEDMECNSEFVLSSPLSIYLQSLDDRSKIMARIGLGDSADIATKKEYAAHPNHSPLGWKMWLMPDQPLIAEHNSPDDGVITEVYRIWLLPKDWMGEMLEGEVVIAHPAPTERVKQGFLSHLAIGATVLKTPDGYGLKSKIHILGKLSEKMKLPTLGQLQELMKEEYLLGSQILMRCDNNPADGCEQIELTEKGLLATGRTLENTYGYQLEEKGE